MLEKLTKKQEKLMLEVRDEYLNKFFSLPRTNKEKAKELIEYVYELSGFKKPNVVFVDSPMACQIAGNILNQVWNQVRDQVNYQVNYQVWNQVFDFGFYLDCSDFGWVSFYDFFSRIGMLNNEKFNRYKEIKDTNIFSTIQFDGLCIVSDMPTKILREGNKLHNTEGYAIEFADGYGQHYLWGIHIEPELFNKIPTMSAKEVLTIKNIEQRMVIFRLLGAEKIFNELGAKLIDKSERGNELYAINGITSKIEKMLRYSCPSTGRVYTKFVEPRFNKADEAQAWSHRFTIEEYNLLKVES